MDAARAAGSSRARRPRQCAIREIKEELGLTSSGCGRCGCCGTGSSELQVFATQAFEGEIVPDPAEVRAWRWVRAAAACAALPTTPGLGEVIAGGVPDVRPELSRLAARHDPRD